MIIRIDILKTRLIFALLMAVNNLIIEETKLLIHIDQPAIQIFRKKHFYYYFNQKGSLKNSLQIKKF